eukprot:2398384-Pyramimonas_sp.AAC.1
MICTLAVVLQAGNAGSRTNGAAEGAQGLHHDMQQRALGGEAVTVMSRSGHQGPSPAVTIVSRSGHQGPSPAVT